MSSQDVAALASTPLLASGVPALVALETLPGRDSYTFRKSERPPWLGEVRSRYPG